MVAATRTPRLRLLPGTDDVPAAPSDEALIEAVIAGDGQIGAHLYDRLSGVISHTLYRVMGHRGSDHEDLVQATFEQVIITLVERRFAGACSLTTWASSLAAHVALNALRARRTERQVLDLNLEMELQRHSSMSGDDLERRVRARDQMRVVRAQLAKMKPEKAEVVLLHDGLGHDLTEIALIQGVSVAAAQSRLVRGRREFMERVARHERS